MSPEPLPGMDPGLDTFPWPQPDEHTVAGSAQALLQAFTWPDLTVTERCLAFYIADGHAGTGAKVRAVTSIIGLTDAEAAEALWGLLRKGFLTRVACWWAA